MRTNEENPKLALSASKLLFLQQQSNARTRSASGPVPRDAEGPDAGGARGAASGSNDGGVLQRRAPARLPEGARPGLRRRGVARPPRRARLRSLTFSISSHARLPRTAQGFKHFSLHLRGREELLVTVHHRDSLVAGDAPDARFDRPPSVYEFLPLRSGSPRPRLRRMTTRVRLLRKGSEAANPTGRRS